VNVKVVAPLFFEFGPFRLDFSERLLLCNGKAVPLAPKVFETLVILLENRGHILEKDELIKRLWPDTFVEESNLAQNICQLRKALEIGASGSEYIETIPKRGYRFALDVREVANADARFVTSRVPNKQSSSEGDQGCLVVKSLAVLPFKPLTRKKKDEYLGLGMAHDTINKLSGLRKMVVLPTRAVFKYAQEHCDPVAVGRGLGVDAILDGTVQRDGERIRVTVQLISLEDGKTLWSGKFDERFTDIFAVQDSISEQVANALALRITADERRHLRRRHTENTEAYQTYLMGLFFWNKRSKEGLSEAVKYFNQAIEQDPGYALAYAGLADSYFLLAYGECDLVSRNEAFEKSRSAALTALELDPFVAEAHAALATVKVKHDKDTVGAERSFEQAITIDPNCAVAYSRYTYFLAAMGRLNEALEKMRRAQELDPLSPDMNTSLASILYFGRQYDEAIRYCQRALVLEPNFVEALLWLGLSYEEQGMFEKSIAQFLAAKDANDDSTEPSELLGYVFATTGQRDEARKILAELHSAAKQNKVHPYNVALIHSALGETEQAFEWLEKPYANWTERLRMLRFDPRMESFREDSRFATILHNSISAGTAQIYRIMPATDARASNDTLPK
jgi:TolB-like protein/Flp pilus assembly protein TadD